MAPVPATVLDRALQLSPDSYCAPYSRAGVRRNSSPVRVPCSPTPFVPAPGRRGLTVAAAAIRKNRQETEERHRQREEERKREEEERRIAEEQKRKAELVTAQVERGILLARQSGWAFDPRSPNRALSLRLARLESKQSRIMAPLRSFSRTPT